MAEITADKNFMGEGMYREHILDHYHSPKNRGPMQNPDITHKELNPVCGDTITIYIKLSPDKKTINEIKFMGSGCAISQASASMLTEEISGKAVEYAKSLTKEKVLEMLAIPISPQRLKCAMLCLDTLQNGIYIHEKYKEKK